MLLSERDVAIVIEIAQAAGRLIMEMQRAGFTVETKSNQYDLVTEVDLASEEQIRSALLAAYPGVGFWGEESNQPPDDEYYWLVDPIDGTVNFALGIPQYAVNIALNRREETLLGVTLALPAGRVYWARPGHGAYARAADGSERRMAVSTVETLQAAMLSTGFPYHRAETVDNNSAEFGYFMPRVHGIRRFGSAAIDLAWVADGIFTAHWEKHLNPWDVSAGMLMIREAGGLVTDYQGAPWSHAGSGFVASNGRTGVHQAILDGLRVVRSELALSDR